MNKTNIKLKNMKPATAPTAINTVPEGTLDLDIFGLSCEEGGVIVGVGNEDEDEVEDDNFGRPFELEVILGILLPSDLVDVSVVDLESSFWEVAVVESSLSVFVDLFKEGREVAAMVLVLM